MTRVRIEDGGIYHIYNRGVEKRDVFLDDGDRIRFIHYLYEFNKADASTNLSRDLPKMKEVGPPSSTPLKSKSLQKPLVDVVAFVLMPNHYHLVLRQRVERGISLFMQKLGTGYTMFFNAKYDHSGVLFQGKFKYKPVTSHEQLQYLLHYVHLNPLPILLNEGGRTSFIERLLEYRWSSLPDYAGRKGFPSVTTRAELLGMFGGSNKYLADLKYFLKNGDEKLTDVINGVQLDERYTKD